DSAAARRHGRGGGRRRKLPHLTGRGLRDAPGDRGERRTLLKQDETGMSERRRVVVTGMGGITALGSSWREIEGVLKASRNAVRYMPEWEFFSDLNTKLAAPIDAFELPAHWTRKQARGMGRVAQLAVCAAERALQDARLLGDPRLASGTVGVACGS